MPKFKVPEVKGAAPVEVPESVGDVSAPPVERKPMTIRLRYAYRGRPSQGRLIAAGTYAADDPALFGLAAYLLKNGHAEGVG